MKKLVLFLAAIIFSFFVVDTVYAGNINENEQAIIEATQEVYEYKGKSYKVDQTYVDQLVTYLKQDNIDITAGDKDLIIQIAYANIELGIKDGYLKPIEDLISHGEHWEVSTEANAEETVKEILESVGKDISDMESYIPSLGGGMNVSDTEDTRDNSDASNEEKEENTSNDIDADDLSDRRDGINSINSLNSNSSLAARDDISNSSTAARADKVINSSSLDLREKSPDNPDNNQGYNPESKLNKKPDDNSDNSQDKDLGSDTYESHGNSQDKDPDSYTYESLTSNPNSWSDPSMIPDDNYSHDEEISKQLADNLRKILYIMMGLGSLTLICILIATAYKHKSNRRSYSRPSKIKRLLSSLYAIHLTLLFSILFLCAGLGIGVFNSRSITNSINENNYYARVYIDVNQGVEAILSKAGLPRTVLSDIISSDRVHIDGMNYIIETMGESGTTSYSLNEEIKARIIEFTNQCIDKEEIEQYSKVTDEIDTISDTVNKTYKNKVELTFVDHLMSIKADYNRIMVILIPILLILIGVLSYMLIRMYRYRYRGLRYIVYALLSSSLLTLISALYLVVTGGYSKLNISPDYYHELMNEYLRLSTTVFVYIGMIGLLLAIALLPLIKYMKNQILAK
ncbi:MAG: hypothetical protein GX379_01660 [Clostridiales bacterium]|nr:hypothetical protein [Clostridiales bacterium]